MFSVYLEPDIKASRLNLRLLEALAAFCLGFEGDGRLEHGAAGANLGRLDRTTEATCAGGEVSCLDFFVVSVALAHLVLEVNRVEISPTTPHCQSHIVGAHCFFAEIPLLCFHNCDAALLLLFFSSSRFL